MYALWLLLGGLTAMTVAIGAIALEDWLRRRDDQEVVPW